MDENQQERDGDGAEDSSAEALDSRYQDIFEHAPVSFWEEDFTEVVADIQVMKAAGIADFDRHFTDFPEIVERLATKVQILSVNQISPTMFGARSKEELLGSLDKVFLPETYPAFSKQMLALAKGETHFSSEAFAGTLAGERIYTLFSVTMLPRRPNGKQYGLVTIQDISWRKRVEDAQAAQERLYRTLLESIPHMVWMADGEGALTYGNGALRRVARRSLEELNGTDWLDLVAADERDELLALRETARQERRAYRATLRYSDPDGVRRTMYFIESPVKDAKETVLHWVGISTDITELEGTRHDLQTALDRSNRELAQIAHAASHDLVEPLRMLSSYAELLQLRRDLALDEKTRRYTEYMVEGAERIRQLIDNLGALSSISLEERTPTPVALDGVMHAVLNTLRPELEASDSEVLYDQLPEVMADEQHLRQLFQLMIDNSIKFRGDTAPRIEVAGYRDGTMHVVSVQDNGQGFDSAIYGDRIFGMFQRLHGRDAYPGTGIGLTLARKIVERSGGRMWVESAPGAGAKFFFTLPAAPSEIIETQQSR